MDLRFAASEQGAETFEDDLVVVDESELDRLCHSFILGRATRVSESPDRVIDHTDFMNKSDEI
jgi:hypothetical protein